ncbi:MAG: non-heme iron oxygenase ferredoxin subunit [Pirellulaceae bacterium]
MSDFVTVAQISEMPPSGKLCVEVDDRFVVVFKVEDEYFCIDDVCSHDGGPLGEGELTGFCIACPRHGAQFDIRTGEALTMPATEPTASHEVRIEGTEIQVKLSDA